MCGWYDTLFAALTLRQGLSSASATSATGSRVLEVPQRDRCPSPEGLDVHIVMDNYATHKTPKIKAWLARRPHYHVHFTRFRIMDQSSRTLVR